jgi:hypothetical protein
MNRRTLLTALVGIAPPLFAQWDKSHRFRVRVRTRSKSIIGTTIEARDQYEAVIKVQKRYPGSTILNLKPDRSEPQRQRRHMP